MGHKIEALKYIIVFSLLFLSGLFVYSFLLKSKDVELPDEVKGDTTMSCDVLTEKVDTVIDTFTLQKNWYLIDVVDYPSIVNVKVAKGDIPEEELKRISLLFDVQGTGLNGNLEYDSERKIWFTDIDLKGLQPGKYTISLYPAILECESVTVKSIDFNLSYPVYVTWSIDWEGLDVQQKYLDSIAGISKTYDMPITHFFNPYIYINLSAQRSKYLTDWVKQRVALGDSIGLHLHMYTKLVEAAGVVPTAEGAWGAPMGQGYDMPNSQYGYDDYKKIVKWGMDQFKANNLPTPTMFRAGGWYIDEENLRVLEDLGFVLDSSGRTSYKLGTNLVPGMWNLQSTTQPYYLNSKDQNILNSGNMELLEVPNNGADSWAFSSKDMIQRFKDNYGGDISKSVKVVTYLSHPEWFNKDEPKMKEIFNYTDTFLFEDDKGPVIYTTIDNLPVVRENM